MPKGIHCYFNLLSQRGSRKRTIFAACEHNMVNGGGIGTVIAGRGDPPYVGIVLKQPILTRAGREVFE